MCHSEQMSGYIFSVPQNTQGNQSFSKDVVSQKYTRRDGIIYA